MQDEELQKYFLFRRDITKKEHSEWYDKLKNDKSQIVFAIISENTHIGNCGFKNINMVDRKAELWIYLGNDNFKGKGLGRKATNLLLSYGFNNFHFNKIYLHVAEFNKNAINLYKQLGFKEEGYFEKELIIGSVYVNLLRMRLFKDEYEFNVKIK